MLYVHNQNQELVWAASQYSTNINAEELCFSEKENSPVCLFQKKPGDDGVQELLTHIWQLSRLRWTTWWDSSHPASICLQTVNNRTTNTDTRLSSIISCYAFIWKTFHFCTFFRLYISVIYGPVRALLLYLLQSSVGLSQREWEFVFAKPPSRVVHSPSNTPPLPAVRAISTSVRDYLVNIISAHLERADFLVSFFFFLPTSDTDFLPSIFHPSRICSGPVFEICRWFDVSVGTCLVWLELWPLWPRSFLWKPKSMSK